MTRTVLFSDETFARKINDRFVSAWINKGPEHTFPKGLYKDRGPGRCSDLPRGTGVTNIAAVFATTDGTVVNAVPGYLERAVFEEEIDFALELAAKLEGQTGREALATYRSAHEARARSVGAPPEPRDRDRSSRIGSRKNSLAEAHVRLAQDGFFPIERLGLHYFDDFAPHEIGCAIR